jgi:hypothetical protein
MKRGYRAHFLDRRLVLILALVLPLTFAAAATAETAASSVIQDIEEDPSDSIDDDYGRAVTDTLVTESTHSRRLSSPAHLPPIERLPFTAGPRAPPII